MEELPLSKLNMELEQFRKDISAKIKALSEEAANLSEEEMQNRITDIQNLQATIQAKTNVYFNAVAENSKKTSYTEDQISQIAAAVKENLKQN